MLSLRSGPLLADGGRRRSASAWAIPPAGLSRHSIDSPTAGLRAAGPGGAGRERKRPATRLDHPLQRTAGKARSQSGTRSQPLVRDRQILITRSASGSRLGRQHCRSRPGVRVAARVRWRDSDPPRTASPGYYGRHRMRDWPSFQDIDDDERCQLLGEMLGATITGAIGRRHLQAERMSIGSHQVVGCRRVSCSRPSSLDATVCRAAGEDDAPSVGPPLAP